MSEVHFLLGFASSRSGDDYREEGYAHYSAALTLAPDNFGAWGDLAQLYVKEKKDALARGALAALCAGAGPDAEVTKVVLADFAVAGLEAGECLRQTSPDLVGAVAGNEGEHAGGHEIRVVHLSAGCR